MSSYKELSGNELNHSYQPSDFQFLSTDDVKGTNEFLGQEEAVDAIRQALKIEDKGFNLYICSENYQRMDDVIVKTVEKTANTKKPGKALGYLYNFHHPNEPTLIELFPETAIAFRDDLEELAAFILNDIPMMLDSEAVKKEQKAIIEEFDDLKAGYLLSVSEKAKEKQLQTKMTKEGIRFTPLNEEGTAMNLKQYEALSEEQLEIINENIEEMQLIADEIIEKINEEEDYYYELYQEVKHEAVLKSLGGMIRKLENKYSQQPAIMTYLNDVAEDLLKNIQILSISQAEEKEAKKDLLPWMSSNEAMKLVKRYALNIISLPPEKGAPVVNDAGVTNVNLQGKILVDTDSNGMYSDFSYIRAGLFHKAQHGYLILHMQNILEKQGAWQVLKNMLRTGEIRIESNDESASSLLAGTLVPEAAKADFKVILIGSQAVYELLKSYDEEFTQHFKIKINLKEELESTVENIEKLAGAIKKIARKEKLPALTIDGLLKMVTYSSRKLGSSRKFHGDVRWFIDLLTEAKLYNRKIVDSGCIQKAIDAREKNDRALQKQLDDTILDSTYLIDTEGSKIGQINGLAVYSIGDLSIGRPLKITATTYCGQSGVVDIDGTAKLSGAIHTKGIQIITGFLGAQFAQDFPLSLNCNICFEQNYAVIDGDSASCAELYTIISSLAELPIYQNLAVTGSMNQFGDVQPIGGVNEKIEGFYKICRLRGLKGTEGVIIPKQNTRDLMLNEEIVESVINKKFHIYEITNVWEGVEILMHCRKEEAIARAYDKLKKYNG